MKCRNLTVLAVGLSVLALAVVVVPVVGAQCCGSGRRPAAKPAEATASPAPGPVAGHVARLGLGLKQIDAAIEATKAGRSKDALAALTKARAAVAETHTALVRQARKAQFANVRCPIMGGKIDPKKVPANLTRQFKGRKVGFCCAGCPAAWDKLSDAQKEAKLKPVLSRRPGAKSAAVNVRCPVMGGKIDPKKVPANLTRQFKGRKVGFCCAGCPAAWDKLSDAQKEAKLTAVLPKSPSK